MLEASLTSAQTAETALTQMLHETTSVESPARRTFSAVPDALPPQKPSEILEAQLAMLKVHYSDDYPEVRRVTGLLERAREAEKNMAVAAPKPPRPEMPGQTSAPIPPVAPSGLTPQASASLVTNRERVDSLKYQIGTADKEIAGMEKDRQTILRELNTMQARIEKLPVREQQLASVTRDYETTKAAYKSLLDKKLSADVATDMEKRQKAERFVMLETARIPEKPVKPKRAALDAGGFLLSLAIAISLAIGLEFRKGAVVGEWEFPASVEILGRVPTITITSSGAEPDSAGPVHRMRWLTVGILMLLTAGVWASIHFGLGGVLK
jgi:hypothetical protein